MVRFVNHINDFFLKNCAISRFLSFSINDAKLKKKTLQSATAFKN